MATKFLQYRHARIVQTLFSVVCTIIVRKVEGWGNVASKPFTYASEPAKPLLNNVRDKSTTDLLSLSFLLSPVTEFTLFTLYDIQMGFSSQFAFKQLRQMNQKSNLTLKSNWENC